MYNAVHKCAAEVGMKIIIVPSKFVLGPDPARRQSKENTGQDTMTENTGGDTTTGELGRDDETARCSSPSTAPRVVC